MLTTSLAFYAVSCFVFGKHGVFFFNESITTDAYSSYFLCLQQDDRTGRADGLSGAGSMGRAQASGSY